MATGYKTHRVLGLRISSTRKEKDIRAVFDEAEKNTQHPISLITVDGWGASRIMAKNLGRPITLVVHKHKRPYDKAVIFRFDYENDKRIVTEVGVKTDFFKRRGKREYYRRTREESLIPPPKMKRGRPKGVKNGQGKKQRKRKKPKKRGRKGLFAVFDKGKRG